MASAHPARRRASTLGVVPVGSGDSVGHCHDVANFLEKWLFISLVVHFGRENFTLFPGVWFLVFFSKLLDMLVAKWEPTPCYRDAYSVGTPSWASWVKGWQMQCKTTFFPFLWKFLLGEQTDFFLLLGGSHMDVPFWEGQASWAWPSCFHSWSTVH